MSCLWILDPALTALLWLELPSLRGSSLSHSGPRTPSVWVRREGERVTVSHTGQVECFVLVFARTWPGADERGWQDVQAAQGGACVCSRQLWKGLPGVALPHMAELLGQQSLVPWQVICLQWERQEKQGETGIWVLSTDSCWMTPHSEWGEN